MVEKKWHQRLTVVRLQLRFFNFLTVIFWVLDTQRQRRRDSPHAICRLYFYPTVHSWIYPRRNMGRVKHTADMEKFSPLFSPGECHTPVCTYVMYLCWISSPSFPYPFAKSEGWRYQNSLNANEWNEDVERMVGDGRLLSVRWSIRSDCVHTFLITVGISHMFTLLNAMTLNALFPSNSWLYGLSAEQFCTKYPTRRLFNAASPNWMLLYVWVCVCTASHDKMLEKLSEMELCQASNRIK